MANRGPNTNTSQFFIVQNGKLDAGLVTYLRKLNFNEFKRHQGTLFFEISKKSLGTDRNFPIMQKLEG